MDKAMLLLQSVAGTQQKRMAPKSFEKDAVKAGGTAEASGRSRRGMLILVTGWDAACTVWILPQENAPDYNISKTGKDEQYAACVHLLWASGLIGCGTLDCWNLFWVLGKIDRETTL